MANINSIYFNSNSKQLFVDNQSNQFIVSGYRLVLDPTLNRDLLLVNPPISTGDYGRKGNIAFDNNHIFYCVDTNKWLRAKLASWIPPGADASVYSIEGSGVPTPTNWWPLNNTSLGNDIIGGTYNFGALPGPASVNFGNSSVGFTNTTIGSCLLNYTSNLVQPSIVNENFTLSFEIKRVGAQSYLTVPAPTFGFIMGSPYGRLGFHLSYANKSNGKTGPYGNRGLYESLGNNIQFALGAHQALFPNSNYRWASVATTTQIDNSNFFQIVCTNDSSNKTIKIYCNGMLEETHNYAATPLGTKYNNPAYQGWGIGAVPRGSSYGTPVNATEYSSQINIKNIGFWRGKAFSQAQVTDLYNGGVFKKYPFV